MVITSRGEGQRELGKGGQSYKINTRDVMYNMIHINNRTFMCESC